MGSVSSSVILDATIDTESLNYCESNNKTTANLIIKLSLHCNNLSVIQFSLYCKVKTLKYYKEAGEKANYWRVRVKELLMIKCSSEKDRVTKCIIGSPQQHKLIMCV